MILPVTAFFFLLIHWQSRRLLLLLSPLTEKSSLCGDARIFLKPARNGLLRRMPKNGGDSDALRHHYLSNLVQHYIS